MSLSGTDNPLSPLVTVASATCASSVRAQRFAVRAFLAPKFDFFFLCALDASLSHLPVILDLCFRELAILPEDDVEAQAEYAECYKYQSSYKYIHTINKIPSEGDSSGGICIKFSS